MRALLLEANGYEVKLFEFISTEHTDKNRMLLAVRRQNATSNPASIDRYRKLKSHFGIKTQHLETILGPPEC